jgi:hypothetical protein
MLELMLIFSGGSLGLLALNTLFILIKEQNLLALLFYTLGASLIFNFTGIIRHSIHGFMPSWIVTFYI